MDKTFSVLTVSKRTGWDGNAVRCVNRQTAVPGNWVVVSESPDSHDFNQYTTSGYGIDSIRSPKTTKPSNLNASLNEGLKRITSDYVIFYQDFIELPNDCFEKLLNLATPNTFVTTCTPNYDGSDDHRYTHVDIPRVCRPDEWESNVAIAPTRALYELGGFDEEYDWGWSWDNVNIAERAAMLGYKFILDESNRPKLYPHEMQSRKGLQLNAARHKRTMDDIREGRRPIKNTYL